MKRFALIALLVSQTVLFAQAPNGVITGRILGLDGKPAAGVRVALASLNANGQITAEALVAITTTDATGQYRMENVPPGRYGIIAGAVVSPTFYPGVVDGLEAKVVTIGPGSTTAGLDFALVNAPGAQQPRVGTIRVPGVETEEERKRRIQRTQIELDALLLLVRSSGERIKGRIIAENGSLSPAFLSSLLVEYYWVDSGSNQYLPAFRREGSGDRPTVGRAMSVSEDGRFGVDLIAIHDVGISLKSLDPMGLTGYTVKSVALGSIDLMKEKLTANGPVSGEIVITLAPVAASR